LDLRDGSVEAPDGGIKPLGQRRHRRLDLVKAPGEANLLLLKSGERARQLLQRLPEHRFEGFDAHIESLQDRLSAILPATRATRTRRVAAGGRRR
jgi:hypothetical protein